MRMTSTYKKINVFFALKLLKLKDFKKIVLMNKSCLYDTILL